MIRTNLSELRNMRSTLEAQQEQLAQLQSTVTELEAAEPALQEAVNALSSAVQAIDTFGPVEVEYEARIEAVRNDAALSDEKKQQQIAVLESAPNTLRQKQRLQR